MYGSYKAHYARFRCRKAFKQTSQWEREDQVLPAEQLCPQCGEAMADMGKGWSGICG